MSTKRGLSFRGRLTLLPDDVNTDYIISSRRKRDTSDAAKLVPYIFEDLTPPLGRQLAPGDILLAGENFGCGSAMEVAVEVLKAAGIKVIVAASYARTFLRNAYNQGLLALELADPVAGITADQLARVEIGRHPQLILLTDGCCHSCVPIGDFFLDLIEAGGLVRYYAAHGGLPRGHLARSGR